MAFKERETAIAHFPGGFTCPVLIKGTHGGDYYVDADPSLPVWIREEEMELLPDGRKAWHYNGHRILINSQGWKMNSDESISHQIKFYLNMGILTPAQLMTTEEWETTRKAKAK